MELGLRLRSRSDRWFAEVKSSLRAKVGNAFTKLKPEPVVYVTAVSLQE